MNGANFTTDIQDFIQTNEQRNENFDVLQSQNRSGPNIGQDKTAIPFNLLHFVIISVRRVCVGLQ